MNSDLKAVLELVEAKSISPEEGRRRIARLRSGGTPSTAPVTAPGTGAEGTARRIAVIGLSGRFSASTTPEEFWSDLSRGSCSVREVPPERWDAERYYDANPATPGRTNSRWGGFLDGIDAFDPLFFNISGHEAERMDPQQRLFLEAAWTALEDAGYATGGTSGLDCGVFAGAPASDYVSDSHRSGVEADAQTLMGNDTAILAARISYLLNLRGPSIALNTACSSSLVAVHLACQVIESGQCEMAIAGGVCLFVGPGFYVSASKADMLSPRGLCRTFDEGADGFVPGEGVGVVVLKDLEAALRDGDHVRGVILAADTNQDGKTNGITAPSAKSQTAVQLSTYRRAGISPESISLVEAHGTGTPLGDPIEVDALTRSFRQFTDRTGFCAIGSVKTNIGHTGQAAGMAGLIKVLLALEHEMIPPTLHFSRENQRINFADTPFYVATEPVPWPRTPGTPRRAALSSFGYSGTNAHLVVEEPPTAAVRAEDGTDHLFLFSAKTEQALERRLTNMREWLRGPGAGSRLSDVAFTLHTGRMHFPHRTALVARDTGELARALDSRIERGSNPAGSRLGAAEKQRSAQKLREDLEHVGDGEGLREVLEGAALLYERGLTPDVDSLFPAGSGRRVSVPTYPFARERYWIEGARPQGAAVVVPANAVLPGESEGPTLEDVSDGARTRYRFRSDGTEFFVNDHVVNGRKVLAGMASLELARAAGRLFRGAEVSRIENVVWHRPLPADRSEGLEIRLTPGEEGTRFDIRVSGADEHAPGATGLLRFDPHGPDEPGINLEHRHSRGRRVSETECYRRFSEMGFDYGPGFRVVREIRDLGAEVVARIGLPPELEAGLALHPLHPGILDGAVQTMIGLDHSEDTAVPRVPYALDAIIHHAPLTAKCDAHLVRGEGGTVDVRLLDDTGRVLVSLLGLTSVPVPLPRDESGILRFEPVLLPVTRVPDRRSTRATLVLDTAGENVDELRRREDGSFILVTPGTSFRRVAEDHFELDPESRADHVRLLDALGPQGCPERVLVLWEARLPLATGDSVLGPDRAFHRLLALCQAFSGRSRGEPLLLRVARDGTRPVADLTALGAFARTARLEDPDLHLQVVDVPGAIGSGSEGSAVWDVLLAAGSQDEPRELWVGVDGTVFRPSLREVAPPEGSTVPMIRSTGFYLVTGGAGHVGRVLARHLLSLGARVVLTGRSEPSPPLREEIAALGGGRIAYVRADAADPVAMAEALAHARTMFGPVNGVVHAAGVVRDSLMASKAPERADEVIAAKVRGVRVLDRLTRDDSLDFLVLCSSLTAAVGNVGQVDYAYANACLDGFANEREAMRERGERRGRTVSVAWPAWSGGGMASASGTPDSGRDTAALDEEEAVALFDEALAFEGPRLLFAKGRPGEVRSVLTPSASLEGEPDRQASPASGERVDGSELDAVARRLLTRVLAEVLRIPGERIDPDEALEAYGFDSVMVTRLTSRLEEDFGPLAKTLFFEYQNLAELAGHFVERYPDVLAARLPAPADPVPTPETSETPGTPGTPLPTSEATAAGAVVPVTVPAVTSGRDAEIAVIGVSGRYPQAPDLDTFWDNLAQGRDSVTEIPEERWPLEGFYTPTGDPGTSYSKWGGFLDGIDRFDSLFFNISPKEAEMMDPQERLFLETTWHLIEDAGYSRQRLAGGDTGVFVGVMYGHYQLFAEADGRAGVSSFASIANRVSYFLDIHGPSLALDTMCSSSLTAIHLACESLRRGECSTAIAGGVNLSPHPRKYLQLSQTGFASSDGRCRSFGADGDGYVPGEGVGALLLKPLAAAVADGDTVHAVIRGSAVNHGGKTNGYTVPNPRAQRSAITDALERSGTHLSEVGYVEAHGTGTALGDPIEVAALNGAFAARSADSGTIPIGSVKSSIGHLESAAGIAAVTKVILQMRHGVLAPSLHANRLNPDIDFAGSPFRVQRELSPWEPVGTAGLVAGVSSFGAGGANAHVILRDHRPKLKQDEPREPDGPQVLVLSARTGERLEALARRTADHMRRHLTGASRELVPLLVEDLLERVGGALDLRSGDLRPDDSLAECGLDEIVRASLGVDLGTAYGLETDDLPPEPDTVAELAAGLVSVHRDVLRSFFGLEGSPAPTPRSVPPRLADVAHTLQSGREAMAERMALVVSDLATAVRALTAFAEGRTGPVPVFRGTASPRSSSPASETGPRTDPRTLTQPLTREGLERLARLWAEGADVEWTHLHAAPRRRVALAGYPFAPDRHWLSAAPTASQPSSSGTDRSVRTSPTPTPPTPPASSGTAAPAERHARVRQQVMALAAETIGLAEDRLDPRTGLADYGFDSMAFKELANRIAEHFGVTFSPAVFFERTGPEGIAEWLVEEYGERLMDADSTVPPEPEALVGTAVPGRALVPAAGGEPGPRGAEPIAIIGMSGRFPGSPDLDRYWENLREQRDLVTEIPAERWDWRELDDESLSPEDRCPFRWGAFIDGADRFDPLFFGISPAEAEMMDPQQRVLLQTVWAAIEDAGYRPSALAGSDVGLFAGIQFSDYQHLMHEAGVLNAQAALGNEHSISVNRISFLLDLHGPSEPVNTACSSSLVAVHRAVRSLRDGESSMAIAGGVALNLASHSTVAAGMMGLLSPDGRCRTLDSRANGYVKGEGVGAVILKPLAAALADGDHVHAVIRGTAVNHGGRAASLTAPNPQAQAQLLRAALEEAEVSPDGIGYLELHGTGTELGDPVEINGIKAAFGSGSGTASCGIGSVKTNIGHLEPASGIAGLLKLILAMRHRTMPGIVHLDEVNPYVDLEGTPFHIARKTMPWEPFRDGRGESVPLRAGVSSFGFGGVNAHAVIEEYLPPEPTETVSTDRDLVFVFSAHTEDSLGEVVSRFRERMDRWNDEGARPRAEAVAFTLRSGREEMPERLAVVAPDLISLNRSLRDFVTRGETGSTLYRGRAGEARGNDSRDASALARSWVQGAEVDWDAVLPLPRSRTPLPSYPFAGQRYWFTAPDRPRRAASGPANGETGAVQVQAGHDPGLRGQELVQATLHDILVRKLKLEDGELDDDRDLQDFGVDSMLSAMIMQVVQEELDVQLPLTTLADNPTVRSLARYVFEECLDGREPELTRDVTRGSGSGSGPARETGDRLPPELLPINVAGDRQISFWVHGATGYSTPIQNLSRALGPEYPVYAFQARGADGHAMPHSVDEMVDHYVQCVRKVQPEGPYVIGGYSFGGLIAMEMARRLSEEGENIRHLIMFDTYPATEEVLARRVGIYDEDFLMLYLANYFLNLDKNPELAIGKEEIAHLPASLRIVELARLVHERTNKRMAMDDIYMYLRGGVTSSDHAEGLYQLYEMRDYGASPVLFFQATDGFTGRASARYWESSRMLDGIDYVTPWRELVEGDFRMVELDNDHLNMLENPTLPLAARHVEAVLKEPPTLDIEQYESFRKSFEAVTEFGHGLLAEKFHSVGLFPPVGSETSRMELSERLEVRSEYTRLFNASVDILIREGYLAAEGERLITTAKSQTLGEFSGSGAVQGRAGKLAAEHSDIADYIPLLIACQEAIVDVMAGRRSGTDVIFPGGSMELVSELYKENIQTDYYNRLVADRTRDHVRSFTRRFPRSTAQVFEVGAGTGATSAAVLDALAETERLRYFYTDIGPAFLYVAEQRFGSGRDFLEFSTYDIEEPPEPQGVEPGSMDVVIASNVLHTTRSIDRTLRRCAELLKPNGILIINELTQRLDFNTLTFGLTSGWWLYEDERIEGAPLLHASGWSEALRGVGFTEAEFLGVPGVQGDEHAQCVIVATRMVLP